MRIGQECVAPIPPKTKLWRYMEAKKVIDLLSSQTLYLARADQFPDWLEGRLADGTVGAIHAELPTDPALAVRVRHEYQPLYMYASCWRMSDVLEPKCFDTYKCRQDGIAMEIEAADLVNSIANIFNFIDGLVQYVDHKTYTAPDGNIFRTIFCKDEVSYKNEREARLVHHAGMPSGLMSKINIENIPKFVRAPLNLSRAVYRLHASERGAYEINRHGYSPDSIIDLQ